MINAHRQVFLTKFCLSKDDFVDIQLKPDEMHYTDSKGKFFFLPSCREQPSL